MQAIVGSNVKVEIESGLVVESPPISISAITQANPGVVTAAGHGLSNGDVVKFSVTEGMVQLDGQAVRVSGVSGATSRWKIWTRRTMTLGRLAAWI